jgi:hypothetical protein
LKSAYNGILGGFVVYEPYTKQALPSKHYRELLGSAICVFNSNNNFIIENILRVDTVDQYTWYELVDKCSGELLSPVKETISRISGTEIARTFGSIITKRNRIVHSFQITNNGEQVLATKDKSNNQYVIYEEYLMEFISDNEKLSTLLHDFRGY